MLRLGLIGYSCEDFDHELAETYLVNEFQKIYNEYHKDVILISGLTDSGIPGMGYKLSKFYGWKTEGFSAKEALKYKCFPVDVKKIIGDNFGDESEDFLRSLDKIIRIGGGKQSFKEIKRAKELNINFVEWDL